MSVSVIGDWDESAFILMAREIAHGHLPYLTFWEMKPIGAGMILSLPMLWLGASVGVARIVGATSVLATSWLLYRIGWRFRMGRAPALIAGGLYAVFSTRLQGVATIAEILLAPFTAAGVLVMLGAPQRLGLMRQALTVFAAGLLFGLAVWIKYVPALPATLVGGGVLFVMLLQSGGRFGRVAVLGIAFSAGLLAPTLLTTVVYWKAGAIDEFVYANFGFASRYIAVVDWRRVLRDLGETTTELWPLGLLAAATALPAARRILFCPNRRAMTATIWLWLLGETAAAILPMQFWPHYFLMVLPPLCLLAALAIATYAPEFIRPRRVAAGMAFAAIFAGLIPGMRHGVETARALGRADVPRRIAAIARDTMRPGETLWVVDYESIIYILADAPLPTRFAFPDHLTGVTGAVTPIDPALEIGHILAQHPALIILADRRSRGFNPSGNPRIKPLVEDALATDYCLYEEIPTVEGLARVYVLRDHGT